MKLAEVVTVLLRVFAVWMIIRAGGMLLFNVSNMVVFAMQGGITAISPLSNQVTGIIVSAVSVLGYTVIALALFAFAGRAAQLICGRTTAATTIDITHIRAGQAYHIATFISGVILVAGAIGPATRGTANLLRTGGGFGVVPGYIDAASLASLVEAALRAGLGVALILGGKQISTWVASLKYDHDAVPNQRVSLGVLLVFVTAFAVLLLFMRFMFRP